MREYLEHLNEEGSSTNYKSNNSSNDCDSDHADSSSSEHSSDSNNPGTEPSTSDFEGRYNSSGGDNSRDSGSCN